MFRLLIWLWSWLHRKGPAEQWQCRKWFPTGGYRWTCQRCRGHLGPHVTFTGIRFTDEQILYRSRQAIEMDKRYAEMGERARRTLKPWEVEGP